MRSRVIWVPPAASVYVNRARRRAAVLAGCSLAAATVNGAHAAIRPAPVPASRPVGTVAPRLVHATTPRAPGRAGRPVAARANALQTGHRAAAAVGRNRAAAIASGARAPIRSVPAPARRPAEIAAPRRAPATRRRGRGRRGRSAWVRANARPIPRKAAAAGERRRAGAIASGRRPAAVRNAPGLPASRAATAECRRTPATATRGCGQCGRRAPERERALPGRPKPAGPPVVPRPAATIATGAPVPAMDPRARPAAAPAPRRERATTAIGQDFRAALEVPTRRPTYRIAAPVATFAQRQAGARPSARLGNVQGPAGPANRSAITPASTPIVRATAPARTGNSTALTAFAGTPLRSHRAGRAARRAPPKRTPPLPVARTGPAGTRATLDFCNAPTDPAAEASGTSRPATPRVGKTGPIPVTYSQRAPPGKTAADLPSLAVRAASLPRLTST